MRSILWMSLISLSLATGACKKKQDETGNAATQAKKTAEDVNAGQGDLQAANADLMAAKDKYASALEARMALLDIKIDELAARADAKSKQVAADLKTQRDQLATKAKMIKDRTAANWNAFTKDVDDSFDRLEKGVNAALK